MPPRDAPAEVDEVISDYPPGIEALLHAIAAASTCHPSMPELANAIGVTLEEIERRVIVGFDAGLLEVWEFPPGDRDERDAITLTPLAAARLDVEPWRLGDSDEYRWARAGSFADREEILRPWASTTAPDEEDAGVESRVPSKDPTPLDALDIAEQLEAAREVLEAEIERTPVPESPIARELLAESYQRRRFSLAGLPYVFISDSLAWPPAPGPDGACGACYGKARGPRRTCLACDDSQRHTEKPATFPSWSGQLYAPEAKTPGKLGIRRSRGRRV